jgi:hypothetical protein
VAAIPPQHVRSDPGGVLGRLAVNHFQKGRGLGRALFRDCALRVAHAIRGIVVHAISEEAKPSSRLLASSLR